MHKPEDIVSVKHPPKGERRFHGGLYRVTFRNKDGKEYFGDMTEDGYDILMWSCQLQIEGADEETIEKLIEAVRDDQREDCYEQMAGADL